MKILKFFVIILSIGIFVSSCNKETPIDESNEIKKEDLVSTESMNKRDSEYESIYQSILNDSEYKVLLKNAIESSKNIKIDLLKNDKTAIKKQLLSLNSNPDFQKLSKYWNQDVFRLSENNISKVALLNATTDLINPNRIKTAAPSCEYNFGIFITTLNQELECDYIEDIFGCCYGLYCEMTNCMSAAVSEFWDQVGISDEQTFNTAFAALVTTMLKGGTPLHGIGIAILAEVFFDSLQYVDMIFDILGCSSEAIFSTAQWSAICNCVCPIFPYCETPGGPPVLASTNLGTYPLVMPEECN